ncbi:MAG TPA: terminase family protein [Trueperaceae bacterium]
MKVITELVERSTREEVRAVVSMPPRHGKTSTILHAFAWLLTLDPSLTHAFATYAQELANSKSRTARRIARDAGVQLADDAQTMREWRTNAGGGLLATGVGGPLTGQGITGLGVVDDPVKNRQEAESALIRDRVWEWFTDVFYTRLEPGASAIVVATRWHQDDLSGRLLADGWEGINLPALDPDTGEALWPERYPVERLLRIKKQVGEYTWASLYQGEPVPRGGNVFQNVTTYDALPSEGAYREAVGFDAAYTAKSHADYSVAVTGRLVGDVLYVTGMVRAQAEPAAFLEQLRARGIRRVTWFRSGTEKGLEAFMRSKGVSVDAVTATGDKFARAQPVAAEWNAGKVAVPSSDAPQHGAWVEALLDEVLAFTGLGDKHDDVVDALAALHHALIGKRTTDPATAKRIYR